jgi:NADPH:quinone reductase-like Zn-dependent oxidoreductase
MRAALYTHYGSPEVVELREVPKPVPKDDEVLIKVHSSTVSSGDWRARSLEVPKGFGLISRLAFGLFKPRRPILGTELSGEIEAVGKNVTRFKVGDQVFAYPGLAMGGHAEYKCMREDAAIAAKPASLSWDEAASLSFGGVTALDFLRRGKIQKGDKVLINGASGAVGTAAVQIAKHFGAEVTGVCSTGNLALVKSIGAVHVIDYTLDDFTRNGETYDIIVDTVGTAPYSRSKRSLKEGGRLLLVFGSLPEMLKIPWVSLTSERKIIAGPVGERAYDLQAIAAMASSGELKPVIDRRYPIARIAEAHRYVDTGHKKGSVVITL